MRHHLSCGGWIEAVGDVVRIVQPGPSEQVPFLVLDVRGDTLEALLSAAQRAKLSRGFGVWRRAEWRRIMAGGTR